MMSSLLVASLMSAHSQPSPIGRAQEDAAEARRVPGTLIMHEGREDRPVNQNFFRPDSAAIGPSPSPQKKHPRR